MIVVKVGGSLGIDYDLVCADIAELFLAGRKLVLVHGGSAETNRISNLLGHPPKTITSPNGLNSRYTDSATMDIFSMVYAGKMNTRIVERLQKLGANAVGLSGLDGRLLSGARKGAIRSVEDGKQVLIRDDMSGKVEKVNTDLLRMLLEAGYLPVVSPPAASLEGEAINVDGDRAAAAIAGALQASDLVILSNVPGLLANFPDENSLIARVRLGDMESAMNKAEGRMKKKVMGAAEALNLGVERVIFADARLDRPVERAIDGQGTVLTR